MGPMDNCATAKQETLLERVSRNEGQTAETLAKQGAELYQLQRRIEFLERIVGDKFDNYPQECAPPPTALQQNIRTW